MTGALVTNYNFSTCYRCCKADATVVSFSERKKFCLLVSKQFCQQVPMLVSMLLLLLLSTTFNFALANNNNNDNRVKTMQISDSKQITTATIFTKNENLNSNLNLLEYSSQTTNNFKDDNIGHNRCNKVHFKTTTSNSIDKDEVPKPQVACQCDVQYCDSHPFTWPTGASLALKAESTGPKISSNKSSSNSYSDDDDYDNYRFVISGVAKVKTRQKLDDFTSTGAHKIPTLHILANRRRQQILGFGGALTDSSAELLKFDENKLKNPLPDTLIASLINDYFGPNGTNYNLIRLPIGGTDFSRRPYSLGDSKQVQEYVKKKEFSLFPSDENDDDSVNEIKALSEYDNNDFELKNFALQDEDVNYKLPLIEKINSIKLASSSSSKPVISATHSLFQATTLARHQVKIFASPWSPPTWMKTNNWFVSGSLKDGDEFMDAYASYLIKFLESYSSYNVSIFALSPQNEPLTPKLIKGYKSNSCIFSDDKYAKFVAKFVSPKLKEYNRKMESDNKQTTNLVYWDEDINQYSYNYLFTNHTTDSKREALGSASGLSWHWYAHGLFKKVEFNQVMKVRRKLSTNKWTISTEASFLGTPSIGNWTRAMLYAEDIINNLNFASSVAWIDWNLVLNTTGGYTWCGNILDSAILIDFDKQVYYKNPTYYALMHFSRFILPNSHILDTNLYDYYSANDDNDLIFVAAEVSTDEVDDILLKDQANGKVIKKRKFTLVVVNKQYKDIDKLKIIIDKRDVENNSNFFSDTKDDDNDRCTFVSSIKASSITSFAFAC